MKSQAIFLIRQIAKIEYPPDLAFQVPDDIFIADIQREAWCNPVPMLHQALVLHIVFSQLGEVVAKRLTACKKLFIGPKTAIQGVTGCINDFGTGKCYTKETDKNEVIRVLVDKVRRTCSKPAC